MPRWLSLILRIAIPLAIVFATWNPDGWSYYQWAIEPLFDSVKTFSASKFLVGALLVAGWVIVIQATRRSIGLLGALLMAAISGGLIWFLIGRNVISASSNRGLANAVLFVIGAVLAVGMSWSLVSRRLTGQSDTDVVG